MEELARPPAARPPAARPAAARLLPLVIDCGRCVARPHACDDCVVSALLGGAPHHDGLEATEVAALAALADSGLVPPLRLVTPETG